MRPDRALSTERLVLGASGALLLAAAGLAGRLALQHMETLGAICGAGAATPHCGWCATAAGLGLAGVGMALAAWRRAPSAMQAARVTARRR